MAQKILTKAQTNLLRKNALNPGADHYPVVKLFTPWAGATWLISELAEDGDTAFGLCDLGLDCVEYGSVSLSEIMDLRGPFGLRVERDTSFSADKPLSGYFADSKERNRIVA